MNKTIFTPNEADATLTIERRFSAEPARVWKYLTEPALLDQWWGPAPWKTVTKQMDFRVGGHWLYSMRGPEGDEHFCRMDYVEIEPGKSMKSDDYFCDPEGKLNPSLPRQVFDTTLTADGSHTRLVTVVRYESVEDMRTIIKMGMQEGLSICYEQLDTLLAA